MQNKTATELVTENSANIAAWKEEHKEVKAITVKSKHNGNQAFIVAKPTNSVLDMIALYEHQGKIEKINQSLIANCVKAGDTSLFAGDIDLKNTVLSKITDLLTKLQVEEKEL